ncbi:MAG: alpha-amylase family protein [Paludibacteraceae bacterium]|nr:alpha-amylase family protein [Paludibacteraceae bacterium]
MSEKIVIYQVMPRLFGNKKTQLTPNGSIEENGCGKFDDFTEKALKEIKDLGATHIWYTGVIEHATQTDYTKEGIAKDHPFIVKGKAGSPYAIKDYYDVDPDLANNVKKRMDEYKALIQRTHKAGLKVIMDFVPNHVARQYKSDAKPEGVKDLGENDIQEVFFDKNNNFYYLPGQNFEPRIKAYEGDEAPYVEFPAKATGNDYFGNNPSAYDWYETVKLNYGVDYHNYQYKDFSTTPDTWKKMADILSFWTSLGIDGFRCDMAEMVPSEFWAWVIPKIKEQNEKIIFIAETYDPNQYYRYIHEGKFDYLYDKVGLYDTLRAIVQKQRHPGCITHCWQQLGIIQNNMLNFLENHDEQRIASDFFAGNGKRAIPAMIISATMTQGPVMIYSGQELGERGMDEEGFSGRDGRTTIFDYWAIDSIQKWSNNGKFDGGKLDKEQKELRNFYKKLLNICGKEKAISEGSFFDLMYLNYENPDFNSSCQYAFYRRCGEEGLLIIANFDANDANIKVNITQIESDGEVTFTDLLTGDKFKSSIIEGTPFALSVKGESGVILKFKVKG